MFRRFIENINKFIQWTKKWHFFHVLFVAIFACFFPLFVLFFISVFIDIFSILVEKKSISSIIEGYLLPFGGGIMFFVLLMIIFSLLGLIVEIFVTIKRAFARKSISVESSFLLENKYYNYIYHFAFWNFIIGTIIWMLWLYPLHRYY